MLNLKKGLIFTTDAVIALGIFLASVFLFYSFFTTESPFGLRGITIYLKIDNYLSVEEQAESFSSIYNLYQKNDSAANQLFELIRSQAEYPANLRMYVLDGSVVKKIMDSSPNNFTEKFVFRRYTVYTLTRNLGSSGTNVIVSAPTTSVNKNSNISVKVHNPTAGQLTNVNVRLEIYNYTNNLLDWTINPSSYTINMTAGENRTLYFSLSVPQNAIVDEYYAKAIVTHPSFNENGTDGFNVVRFGIIEMESGI